MLNNYLNKATLGKNDWWRYVLTILMTILGVVLVNVVIRQILPTYKSLFPDNQFGKDLGTMILVLFVFGVALLMFFLAISKLHQRPIMTLISNGSRFNWSYYFAGFIVWGILLFGSGLITDYSTWETFLDNFNAAHFFILLIVGFISIGVQSFFEEIVIRGYFLQGLSLKMKNLTLLILTNALIFGVLHFGYGIASFLHSFTFGIAFVVIVIFQSRIEFVSGAHNANNLLLSLVFLDLAEATNEEFSWAINFNDLAIHLVILLLLVGIAYKFFKK